MITLSEELETSLSKLALKLKALYTLHKAQGPVLIDHLPKAVREAWSRVSLQPSEERYNMTQKMYLFFELASDIHNMVVLNYKGKHLLELRSNVESGVIIPLYTETTTLRNTLSTERLF